ncbi:PAS domain-containing protein [Bacillus sp. H-16]|uniref:two-component system sensor histidine kinase NtrB n=1 Tax=Alteribacter salitolerans TaxID=2912333 RepID=UPI0019646523|nr:ATP-binding protein [Alteribacter salitolerans]MBM7094430.1 PAS domain-containing protein [Alteribacter salitolerans]
MVNKQTGAEVIHQHLDIGTLLNALPIGVLVVDPEGEFVYINDLVYKAWGANPVEQKKHSVHQEYIGWWRETGERVGSEDWAVVRALQKGESSYGEVIDIQRFDGTKGAILNSAVPIYNGHHDIIGAVVTISDITKMRNLEIELNLHKDYLAQLVEEKTTELIHKNEQLQVEMAEKEQMQKQLRQLDQLHLVGEMASGFAHEIRNPLTTVKGFIQLLGKKETLAQYDEMFSLMLEEINRADSIITTFLDLAKDKKVDLQPVNLNEIIEELLPSLRMTAQEKHHQVVLKLKSGLPDICADEKEIKQLIKHIFSNGIEAMDTDQTILIETDADSERVMVKIEDEGKGISDDIKEKIGTPFFTTKDDNTGLGMSICYSIAERNSGQIELESKSPGTCCKISFEAIAKPPSC